MTWSLGLFLGLTLFFQGDVLVLKNGRKMACDSYTVDQGRVKIQAQGQTFSLPESAIDWRATENAKVALTKKKNEAEAQAQKEAEAKKERRQAQIRALEKARKEGELSLTNKDFRKDTLASKHGPFKASFHMLSNSVIVAMHINDQGPFDFVLDTGASVTMIDPYVLSQAGVTPNGPNVNIHGVGGQPVKANTCKLKKLALGDAVVHEMDAVAHRIDHLFQNQVYGLIGQDFLNHFVVNLDAASKTLTLTPQSGVKKERVVKRKEKAEPAPEPTYSAINEVFIIMESQYRLLGQDRDSAANEQSLQTLQDVEIRILKVKKQLRAQRSLMEISLKDLEPGEDRDFIQGYLECMTKFDLCIEHLLIFHSSLTQAAKQAKASQKLLEDLKADADRARKSDKDYHECYIQLAF